MSPETTRALLRGSVLTRPLYTQAETHSALARRGDSIRTTPQQRIVARLDISLRRHLPRHGLPRTSFLGGKRQWRFHSPKMPDVRQSHTPTRKHNMPSSGSPLFTLRPQQLTGVPQTDDHQASKKRLDFGNVKIDPSQAWHALLRHDTLIMPPPGMTLSIRHRDLLDFHPSPGSNMFLC